MDPDSDEDDPARLLSAWLGELDNLKNDLDNGMGNGNTLSTSANRDPQTSVDKKPKSQYRFSLINLETSQNDELDAILGELTQLENKFDEELSDDKNWEVRTDKKIHFSEEPEYTTNLSSSIESPLESSKSEQSSLSSRSHQDCTVPGKEGQEIREIHETGTQAEEQSNSGFSDSRGDIVSRTGTPDTDSAFCDITDSLSVLSVSSGKTDQSKTSISIPSTLNPLSPTSETEEEAKIKAEKIKIAIEKIKEASVKKLFIKVFTSNGSAKLLLVDEKMTVGHVTRILAEKNHVKLDPKWALVELVPDLYVERVYEDHEMLVENCLLWKVDSKNTLWFIERPEKFDLFARPEMYLLGTSSSEKDEQMEEHSRQELLEEYFSSTGVGAPELEGQVWLKAEGKKTWKKFHFVLRSSGLYYAPKGKKTSKDLVCLTTFDMNQVYYGVGWRKKYKSPSDNCFAIKHPTIQTKNPKYIRYLCVDTQTELHQWVTGIRIAKYGRHLFENHRQIVEEITHADIDILTSKRFSVNSSIGLPRLPITAQSVASSGSQENGVNSNLRTPSSENKSMASALSSGIEADMYNESPNEEPVNTQVLPVTDHDVEENSERTPTGTFDREHPIRRSFSRSSHSSSSSGCLSHKSSGVEQGFESNSPLGGTIKKRPTTGTPRLPLTNTTWSMVKEVDGEAERGHGENMRLGAGGTLLAAGGGTLRRKAVRKNTTTKSDSDLKISNRSPLDAAPPKLGGDSFRSVVSPPPPPGLNIPPPGMNMMSGSFSEDLPLPPPPPCPDSLTSLGDIDILPPPPPDIWETNGSSHYHVSPVKTCEDAWYPPPTSKYPPHRPASSNENNNHTPTIPSSDDFSGSILKPNISPRYGSNSIQQSRQQPQMPEHSSHISPAPVSVPFNKRPNSSSIKSASSTPVNKTTRRISFDDNVQLITPSRESNTPQSIPKFSPFPPALPSPNRLYHEESKVNTPPKEFLADLQRVMTKKWQIAEKCRGDSAATPHKVMGFKDDLGAMQQTVYNKDSAIGAWVLETQQYVPTNQQAYQPQHTDSICHQQYPPPHPQVYNYNDQAQHYNYSHQQQQEAQHRHIYAEKPFQGHHQEQLYSQGYPELPCPYYEEETYGHNSSYQVLPAYDQHHEHNQQKPVILREPGSEIQEGSRSAMPTKRPPPPPRRSQNTQLSKKY